MNNHPASLNPACLQMGGTANPGHKGGRHGIGQGAHPAHGELRLQLLHPGLQLLGEVDGDVQLEVPLQARAVQPCPAGGRNTGERLGPPPPQLSVYILRDGVWDCWGE